MTTVVPSAQAGQVFYPSSDGEPLAETSIHIDAIISLVVALRQYFAGQSAIVLTNQFFYYAQGFSKLRVAPDGMVIFNVPPGPRDNYKTWEEGQIPSVIFEVTSEGTRDQDQGFKKTLYEQLEVPEYWMFDPKGEWIPEQLRGYRLRGETYEPITDNRSQPLGLRLQVEGHLISFYREDTGEKLLVPDEMAEALHREIAARLQAEQRAEQERQRAEQERQRAERAEAEVERLKARLRDLGVEPNGGS